MILAGASVFLGFLIGAVSGATGIGGGTLLAPFLMFVLKVDPFVSVGTDLVVSVVTKAIGSFMHKREDNVDKATLLPLCAGGLAGALIGVVILLELKHHYDGSSAQIVLRRAIGLALCLSAVAIATTSLIRKHRADRNVPSILATIGGVVGSIATLTGVGVGSLSVPALYLIKGRTALPRIVGTSLVFATAVTAVGALSHMALGDVNYRLCLLLLCGSCPGVVCGSLIAGRASSILKPAVIALLILSGARLIA